MAAFPGFGRSFDFALRAMESSQPLLLPILRQANLFCFPHDPVEVIGPGGIAKTDEQKEFWMENFALPYPVTAIEDKTHMVAIWDADCLDDLRDDGTNVVEILLENEVPAVTAAHPLYVSTYPKKGLKPWRFFVAVRGSWSWTDKERNQGLKGGVPDWMPNPDAEHCYITFGVIQLKKHERTHLIRDGFESRVVPLGVWVCSRTSTWLEVSLDKAKTRKEYDEVFSYIEEAVPDIAHEAHGAMEQIMWFNDPDRFVVEETREESKGRSKKWGNSKRSKERPTYHSCTALDIKKIRNGGGGGSEGTGSPKRGHHRRGHYRTLRADRYARSGMQGKTILVRPCYVGDETFSVGRHHYRVLLGENEVLVGEQQNSPQSRAG